MNMKSNSTVLLVLVLVAVAGLVFFTARDNRTGAERLGDAIAAAPNGLDKAAEQLEDRTPAQKAGDAIEDATDGKR